jgi:hypothetical protein
LTIFAHVGRPGESPLAQADGDSWQGALPLAIWRPGDLIHDERTIPRPQSDEPLFLILGIYDWVSGQRLPVADAQGHPLAGYGYVVPLP